jgi:hypothetical protein
VALSQEQADKVEAWRKEKGVDKCIACGFDGEMGYADMVATPIMGTDLHITLEFGGGTTGVIGMLPTVCPNCGFMMIFEPTTVGIVERRET